jgi:hypothetical protein
MACLTMMSTTRRNCSSGRKLLTVLAKIGIFGFVCILMYSKLSMIKLMEFAGSSQHHQQIHAEKRIQILLLPHSERNGPILHPDKANMHCSFDNRCYFTGDLTSWNESDAVLVHGNYRRSQM